MAVIRENIATEWRWAAARSRATRPRIGGKIGRCKPFTVNADRVLARDRQNRCASTVCEVYRGSTSNSPIYFRGSKRARKKAALMNNRLARTGLALVTLLFLCVGINAAAEIGASALVSPIGLKGGLVLPLQGQSPIRPFKLKGGGQIDIDTFTFSFAGQSTHLGQYTASGTIDPSTFQIQGAMTSADGDTLNWVAYFQFGPLGEIEATFTFAGGTGRFVDASGSATGPIALDPDFMFTINLLGTIAY